ncbi:MAG: TVP38/TMEM64 family protein [Planctomycetes bacterium]|nr:TVP38/TMEM64 family protein [Planctomycetota bacterium]
MDDARRARAHARLVRGLSLAPLAVLALLWAAWPWLRTTLNRGVELLAHGELEALRAWADELGPSAAVFTTLLMIVQALAAPIPAVLVTWTNSWLFGPFVGAWLSIGSATLAALLCFLLARSLGAPWVAGVVSAERRAKAERFVERHGAVAVLGARLLPFVPFDPISYVAGLTGMRAWTFVWATFVGQSPAGFVYSYLGQELARPARFAWLAASSFVALVLVGLAVRRALRSPPS